MNDDPNWTFFIVNIFAGIAVIVFLSLLRAARPELVPDKTFFALFWSLWKQVVDTITDPHELDADLKMNMLEKRIQWDMREWDILYEEKLTEQIKYYKEKLNAKILAIEKKSPENIPG